MPKALDLPVEPITGRPRFVTERQPLVFGGQLSHQLGGGRRRVVELAQKPNLVAPTAIRDCNRITQLCSIESHESFVMIAHDSPSLFEALPTIRATLALTSRVSRLSKGRGIRSEMLKLSTTRPLLPKADTPTPPGTPPLGPCDGGRATRSPHPRAAESMGVRQGQALWRPCGSRPSRILSETAP